MSWIVYRHLNKINGKSYIGITSHDKPNYRWRNGYGYANDQPLFWRAIQKYGWDNFEHLILEDNIETMTEANAREKYWIAFYHTYCYDPLCNGYNLTIGGDGHAGHPLSEETRKKISQSHMGKTISEETRQKISLANVGANNPFYGKKHTLETRQKIIMKNTGRKQSEETKQKISKALKGRPCAESTKQKLSEINKGKQAWNKGKTLGPMSETTKKKLSESKTGQGAKAVRCVETGSVFNSLGEAAIWAKTSCCSISNHLAGRQKTAGGYHWEWVGEKTDD